MCYIDSMENLKIPSSFILCQKSDCKKSGECLRFLAYRQSLKESEYLSILNPEKFPEDKDSCSRFKSSEKIKVAWGIKNIFNQVPFEKVKSVKRELLSYFGRTKYYRFFREELPILPENQAKFKQIFKSHGIEDEIAFTRFTEEFDW